MENPFAVYAESLAPYVAGEHSGQWLALPMEENALRVRLQNILGPSEELFLTDYHFREDCQYMGEIFTEYSNIYDLNTVAYLAADGEHPSVAAYCQSQSVTVEELANLFCQEADIPFYAYEFEGIEHADYLSAEEKMGRTIVGRDQELVGILRSKGLEDYLDYEAIGREASYSGITLFDNGYIESRGLDSIHPQTMQEIREELAQERLQETQRNIPDKKTTQPEPQRARRQSLSL